MSDTLLCAKLDFLRTLPVLAEAEGVSRGASLVAVGGVCLVVGALIARVVLKRKERSASVPQRARSETAPAPSPGPAEVPAQLVVQDFSALQKEFERLRAAGLHEIQDKIREDRGVVAVWLGLVNVVTANRRAVDESGLGSVEEFVAGFGSHQWEPYGKLFRVQLQALWVARSLGEEEFSYFDHRGQARSCYTRFEVGDKDGKADWSRVTVLIVDTSTATRTVAAVFGKQELMRAILSRANIVLWWARVERVGDRMHWQVNTPKEAYSSPLYKLALGIDVGALWTYEQLPDRERMDKLSFTALTEGRPGYQQEYRVVNGGETRWVSEDVVIQRVTRNEWTLVGVLVDVTERKKAEEARQRAALQVRQILERADCMVWEARVTRIDGNLQWLFDVPPSGLKTRIFGTPEGLNTDWIYKDMEVPQFAQKNITSANAILHGNPGYEQEFQVIKPDGQSFWLHERVAIFSISPGCWDLVGVTIDVTAQHAAQEAQLAAETEMKEILMRADCLFWRAAVTPVADGQFRWKFFIPPSVLFREIFGADPALDRNYLWLPSDNIPEYAEMIKLCDDTLKQKGTSYEQEFRVISSGRTFWLHEHVSIKPLRSNEWNLVGVIMDDTDRREAEQALAAEKERLTVTLRAMSEGVITVDAVGVIQYINRAAAAMIQWDVDQAVGHKISELCVFQNTASSEPFSPPLAQVLKEGLLVNLPVGTTLMGNAGRNAMVEGCFAPVQNSASSVVGAVLVFRDVTERLRLEEQIQRATKMESVGLLAGGIAHDFNNILTAILGNITLAKLDLNGAGDVENILDEAQRATARAKDLTQQLLTFAKGGDPVRSTLLLPQVISDAASFALHGSSIKCGLEIAPDLWPANADKGQISQVVHNLALNAVQAMPDGGSLRIIAHNQVLTAAADRALAPGDYVRIAVVDTGLGIDPGNRAKIFDPYFTTKSFGHGLGLATVYSIIKKHQGHIEVDSAVGAGTTFTVWLPASHEHPPVLSGNAHGPVAALKGRALFMDDDVTIQRVAAKILPRLGLAVDFALDGQQAVHMYQDALAAGKRYDVVIMDLTIPGGMGGKEAIVSLRALDPAVNAIVSSGYSSDPVMADFRAHGFSGMVAKPYDITELLKTVRRVLEPHA